MNKKNLQLELSATFGLQILKFWKTDEGSVVLLTVALEFAVDTFVVVAAAATELPPNIDVCPLDLVKLKSVALDFVDDGSVDVGADAGDENGVEAGTETGVIVVAASPADTVGMFGFNGAVDVFVPPNEKLDGGLVLVIDTELTIGMFSLSFFVLSMAELRTLPMSNLNEDVGAADVCKLLNRLGGCGGVASKGVFWGAMFGASDIGAASFFIIFGGAAMVGFGFSGADTAIPTGFDADEISIGLF